MKTPTAESSSIATGIVAALGASTCCVLPLVLVSVGVGGVWIAQLRALERLFPVFVLVAIGAFGFAFYRLYLKPQACAPGSACTSPDVRRRQRIAFWVTLIAAKALIVSPYVAPYLLGSSLAGSLSPARADLSTKSAEVSYDPAKVSAAQLERAVTEAGYPAKARIK